MKSQTENKRDFAAVLFCCSALLLCLLVADPWVASPFNDDWSYSHVAMRFAETGRFIYNGWGSPTIVFQTLWGGLFIKLFGFSFNLLRLITLPFSLGFVALSYLLARRMGLRRDLSLFAALCLAVSPLYVPLAASFMTEPYSCFFSLLCVYAAVRASESDPQSRPIVWLLVLTASGILGGSNRQTVWAVPFVLIPYLVWLRWGDRRFFTAAAGCYATWLISFVFVVSNFSQKYGPMELSKSRLLLLFFVNGLAAAHQLGSIFLSALLMSLPALLCFLPQWRNLPRRHIASLAALCLVLFDYLLSGFGVGWGTVPFNGNILTTRGLIDRWRDGLGYRPVLLRHILTYPLTYLLLLSIAVFVYLAVRRYRTVPLRSANAPVLILLLFLLSYLPFLVPGAVLLFDFDRYMLPVLPVILIFILLPLQDSIVKIPAAAWLCLIAFSVFSILTTHDYFRSLQARQQAASLAIEKGVPSNHVSAGLEHDAWKQLQLTGHAKTALYGDKLVMDYNKFWFWSFTPAIVPDYVAVSSAFSLAPQSALTSVPFTAWTPPFHRAISVVKRENIPYDQDYWQLK